MVFEIDSIGYEFFIILRGRISVHVKIPTSEAETKRIYELPDTPAKPKTAERSKSEFDGVPKSPANVNSTILHKNGNYYVVNRTSLLKDVSKLGTGASFGDAALTPGKSAPRNATILCVEDCHFAVLDKHNYERIIGEHQQRENADKVNFLKKVSLFSYMTDASIKTLIYFLEINKYAYRDTILEQGQDNESVFFIRSGTVKVGEGDAIVGAETKAFEARGLPSRHPTHTAEGVSSHK